MRHLANPVVMMERDAGAMAGAAAIARNQPRRRRGAPPARPVRPAPVVAHAVAAEPPRAVPEPAPEPIVLPPGWWVEGPVIPPVPGDPDDADRARMYRCRVSIYTNVNTHWQPALVAMLLFSIALGALTINPVWSVAFGFIVVIAWLIGVAIWDSVWPEQGAFAARRVVWFGATDNHPRVDLWGRELSTPSLIGFRSAREVEVYPQAAAYIRAHHAGALVTLDTLRHVLGEVSHHYRRKIPPLDIDVLWNTVVHVTQEITILRRNEEDVHVETRAPVAMVEKPF